MQKAAALAMLCEINRPLGLKDVSMCRLIQRCLFVWEVVLELQLELAVR
jgi:hypothetical protein